jgi:uncharacterized membrane protein
MIIPTAIILYIFVWIVKNTESFFKPLVLLLVPEHTYLQGMGFFTGIILVFFVGLLLKFWIVQQLRQLIENLIEKTPVISSIYGGMKDFFNFFSSLKDKKDSRVVLVELPAFEGKIIGFVTQKQFHNFHQLGMDDPVLIYFQMSYQVGGYSIFLPKSKVTPVDMGMEEAMRYVMTAGISTNNNRKEKNEKQKQD